MSSVVIQGDTSGSVTLQAPAVAGTPTLTLPTISGTLALTNGTTAFTDLTVTNGATIQGLTVGKGAGAVSTNTAVGASALAANTSGSYNAASGYLALAANTTGGENTAVGAQSLRNNTTGSYNSGCGVNTLFTNTTGTNNVAVGENALYSNTSGSYNVASGYDSLRNNTTASSNTAVGFQAGYQLTTGGTNQLFGLQAGYALTTGVGNFFAGYGAGGAITTGSYNSVIGNYNGNQGGLDIRTANNYIVLSDGAGNPRGIFDNNGVFLIGKTAKNNNSGNGFQCESNGTISVVTAASTGVFDTYELYSTGASAYRFYVTASGTISATNTSISAISDARLKENIRDLNVGLDAVMALKPRLYDWKEGKGANIKNARGFIAQEFEQVFPDLIDQWKDPAPEGEEPYKSVRQDLIPVLVKAIQELKAEIDQLKGAQ